VNGEWTWSVERGVCVAAKCEAAGLVYGGASMAMIKTCFEGKEW
jgi:hypothetical protein